MRMEIKPDNQIAYPARTAEESRAILEKVGLPLDTWGVGPTKTFEDLWEELRLGEAWLDIPGEENRDQYGEVIRVTHVLAINVFCEVEGKVWRLCEEKQVFKDGRGERRRELISSLAEKIRKDEDQEDAVVRALQEELGVLHTPRNVMYDGSDEMWKRTQTYPGLSSQLLLEKYTVLLHPDDFQPDGYVEDQVEKQTFFIWEEATA